MPNLLSTIASLLEALGIRPSAERHSPLGYREVSVDPESLYGKRIFDAHSPDTSAIAIPDTRTNYFKSSHYNTPSTVTHERIHQGQFNLANQPSLESIIEALSPLNIPELTRGYASAGPNRSDPLEPPAYTFQQVDAPTTSVLTKSTNPAASPSYTYQPIANRQQLAFNNYIDLMYRANPRSSYHLEAAMPEPLLAEYVRSHPRPAPGQAIQPSPQSLLDLIKRLLPQ
jgi:hypothetical protein